MNTIFKILLLPFSLLYGIVVSIKNFFYRTGVLKSVEFDFPVIGVGNLSVGGTGKTPMVEYLIRLLRENGYQPGVISRGYKRKGNGFLLLTGREECKEAGDEPFQIKQKFPEVAVAVCKNRAAGIQKLIESSDIDVVIMDDAFQHRKVKPGLNMLLTQYSRPFNEDFLLPSGRLREPKSCKNRADLIVMTKSYRILSPFEVGRIKESIKPKTRQEIYFSYIAYHPPVSMNDPEKKLSLKVLEDYQVVLFTGIGNPAPLENYLNRKCKEIRLIKFADHHWYTRKDYKKVAKVFDKIFIKERAVLTTEKDARRIQCSKAMKYFQKLPIYYLPIDFIFHQKNRNKKQFDQRILDYVGKDQRSL